MKNAELLSFIYIVVWTIFYISKLDNAVERWTENALLKTKLYKAHTSCDIKTNKRFLLFPHDNDDTYTYW